MQPKENTISCTAFSILPLPHNAIQWSQLQRRGLGQATALEAGTHASPCPLPPCFPFPPRASGSWKCKKQLIWLLNSRRAIGHKTLKPASLPVVHGPSPHVLFFLWVSSKQLQVLPGHRHSHLKQAVRFIWTHSSTQTFLIL